MRREASCSRQWHPSLLSQSRQQGCRATVQHNVCATLPVTAAHILTCFFQILLRLCTVACGCKKPHLVRFCRKVLALSPGLASQVKQAEG